MPRGVFNWSFHDVEKFLRSKGFQLNHIEGSHYYFTVSLNGIIHQVCVPFHGSKTFKPRTLKGIIVQSGFSKEEWLAG
ncbi:type II toxin-antitoxin system HicA family toxin [Candidatus Parcubacteria bacterium]|nr:MAG: type II toxin-antitoxin system HicA family toxin [Candidatus Parcubacteria bacterium]